MSRPKTGPDEPTAWVWLSEAYQQVLAIERAPKLAEMRLRELLERSEVRYQAEYRTRGALTESSREWINTREFQYDLWRLARFDFPTCSAVLHVYVISGVQPRSTPYLELYKIELALDDLRKVWPTITGTTPAPVSPAQPPDDKPAAIWKGWELDPDDSPQERFLKDLGRQLRPEGKPLSIPALQREMVIAVAKQNKPYGKAIYTAPSLRSLYRFFKEAKWKP